MSPAMQVRAILVHRQEMSGSRTRRPAAARTAADGVAAPGTGGSCCGCSVGCADPADPRVSVGFGSGASRRAVRCGPDFSFFGYRAEKGRCRLLQSMCAMAYQAFISTAASDDRNRAKADKRSYTTYLGLKGTASTIASNRI